MGDLSYSSNALDTLSLFHRKDYIIYVEGPDDITFWRNIFSISGLKNFEVKPAGGVEEIIKYSNSITNDNVDIIVARDSDYDLIFRNLDFHPRIIHTYGYSIENSLYSVKSVSSVVEAYCRTDKDFTAELEVFFNEFTENIKELLIYDMANQLYNRGSTVMGDNCTRYMQKNSYKINILSVKSKIDELSSLFSNEELLIIRNYLKSNDKELKYIIRGHFLTNAILNFIKSKVKEITEKNVTISLDSLYVNLVTQIKLNYNEKDIIYLIDQINTLQRNR